MTPDWSRSCFPPEAVQELTALSDLAGSPASGEARALDRSLLRGVAWTAAARWGSQGLNWLAWLIVARLLSHHHNFRVAGAFAEHHLSGMRVKITAAASRGRRT